MHENQTLDHTKMLTWPTPTGVAASNKASQAARSNHYLATTETVLANGVSVIPNSETLVLILKAWDDFGMPVIINDDSYVIRT